MVAVAVLAFIALSFAQDDVPTFHTQAASALVWGDDNSIGAVSSNVLDPVTGNSFHKLSHGGIDVSSRLGFERISMSEAGELLNFTTTIVNNTPSDLSVRYGGSSVDGRVPTPLAVVFTSKGLTKRKRKEVFELAKMHCFSSGFLSRQNFFSTNSLSQTFTVAPRSALTVSLVAKDPRYYSMRCSIEGCHPTGTMRFAVTVNTTDFVFVWPGRSAVYCGE
jgi:hypothetical protein